jgi:hypothetical protein
MFDNPNVTVELMMKNASLILFRPLAEIRRQPFFPYLSSSAVPNRVPNAQAGRRKKL